MRQLTHENITQLLVKLGVQVFIVLSWQYKVNPLVLQGNHSMETHLGQHLNSSISFIQDRICKL